MKRRIPTQSRVIKLAAARSNRGQQADGQVCSDMWRGIGWNGGKQGGLRLSIRFWKSSKISSPKKSQPYTQPNI
jgi:hypothetical protein